MDPRLHGDFGIPDFGSPGRMMKLAFDEKDVPASATGVIVTDLDALARNYVKLRDLAARHAVVKVVRGAGLIGATAGFGMYLAALTASRSSKQAFMADVERAGDRLHTTRPTAVNLAWGVDRATARLAEGGAAVLAEALALLDEDVAANKAMGERGADLLTELCPEPAAGDGRLTIHTHCNAGALATVDWGTALGVVHTLHDRGRIARVFADETRPLLQGARLTAWELDRLGIDYRVLVDGAAASVIARGLVDVFHPDIASLQCQLAIHRVTSAPAMSRDATVGSGSPDDGWPRHR